MFRNIFRIPQTVRTSFNINVMKRDREARAAFIVTTIDKSLRGGIKLGLPSLRSKRELARRNNEVTKSRLYDLHGDFVPPFPACEKSKLFHGSLRHYDEKVSACSSTRGSETECGSRRSKAYNVGYARRMTEKHFSKLMRLFSVKKKAKFIPAFLPQRFRQFRVCT